MIWVISCLWVMARLRLLGVNDLTMMIQVKVDWSESAYFGFRSGIDLLFQVC